MRNLVILGALALALGFTIYVKNAAIREKSAVEEALAALPGQTGGLPMLLDLGLGACITCKMMAPILEGLKKDCAGELVVRVINLMQDRGAAEKYALDVMPTQIFFDAVGKELFRNEGFYSRKAILGKWKELGFEFSCSGNSKSP